MTLTLTFDSGTRTRILVDMVLDFDPTGTTVEYRLDAAWYPATWQGTPVAIPATSSARAKWTQTARTTAYFAGPDADQTGATALALGRHEAETRVTSGTDIITWNSPAVIVKV